MISFLRRKFRWKISLKKLLAYHKCKDFAIIVILKYPIELSKY